MAELNPGDSVERYTVVRKLGEGGMAAVYLVTHDTLGTQHALKVLTVGGRKLRERLVNEGRVQASIDHPNVVAVRDVLDVEESPALLMDFVAGPDLETWLQNHTPDPQQAEQIFRQIVDAVLAAHREGLVHRDLKPANVLLHELPDGTLIPKVADFGLAKALADDNPSLAKTRQGAAMGTPSYMAPEQIRDASSVDHRADIWALGCILYELTTGELAFRGLDIVEVFNSVTSGSFEDPADLAPNVRPAVHRTITGCLQTEVDDRLPDCRALLSTLDTDDGAAANATWDETPLLPTSTEPAPAASSSAASVPVVDPDARTLPPHHLESDDKTPMGWAIPLVGAVVLGGGSLLAVTGFVALFVASGVNLSSPCGVADGTDVGVTRVPAVFLRRKGAAWVLPTDRTVHAHPPREDTNWEPGSVTCKLPAGTTLTLVDDPQRAGRAGSWVTVRGGRISLPEPKDDNAEAP